MERTPASSLSEGRGFINPHPLLRDEASVRSMANLGYYKRGEWLIGPSKLLLPLFSCPILANVATSSNYNEVMQLGR